MDGLHIFLSFHRMPFHCDLLFPFHFSLIQSHLSIFWFYFLYFWYQIQEVIAKTNVKKFPPTNGFFEELYSFRSYVFNPFFFGFYL